MIIKHLTLYSKNLPQQKKFFCDVAGFKLLSETKDSFEIKTGLSVLKFVENSQFKPYHYAFGIPYSLYPSALTWLKDRVVVLKDGENEVVDFPAWEAKALYFYDADNNICEFIARKELPETKALNFDIHEVYNLAEIGLVNNNIKPIFETLHLHTNVRMYDGSLNKFLAIGDYRGLFISIDRNKKTWFPTDEEAYIADFIAQVEILNFNYNIFYSNEELEIKPLD